MIYRKLIRNIVRRSGAAFISLLTVFCYFSPAITNATHIIKKGDTLWDLAFAFLGDPFQWPHIWNVNPSITNPDLIFPGNLLNISDSYSEPTAISTTPQMAPRTSPVLTSPIFAQIAVHDSMKSEFEENNADSTLLLNLKNRNPFDKSFLMKVPFLWTEKDPQGNIYPGKGIINKPKDRASFQLYENILIKPQVESYFETGDTLDIFVSIRFVEFEGRVANIVKRIGRCRVIESAPRKVVAVLFEQWDIIRGQERADKTTTLMSLNVDSLFNPEIAITGTVFTRVEQTPSPYPYQTVIIDKGAKDGVSIGDIFGIYHFSDKRDTGNLKSVGIIAHANLSSSSLQLMTMEDNQISVGDKAIRVKRIKFLD